MQLSWATTLNLAGLTAAAIIPRADDKGTCDCPTFGPTGTCKLTKNPFLASNAPSSAVCGTKGFNYVCQGTYDSPNCNACAQSLLGNIPRPGRATQCDGSKFCSKDNGLTFYTCAANEAPFVTKYATSIEYSADASAAVVASGSFDIKWLHTTVPQWLQKICYGTSCEASPASPPSQNLAYKGAGMGLSQGTLTLGVSEAQFDPDVPVERDTIINLASLAIIRATKCETVTYKDKCTAHTGDCDLQKIVVCKAPSDFNIQMKSYDSQGNSALHAMLHVQLKWDDKKTPFDCSVLDTASSLVDAVAGQTDLEKASKVTGAVVAVCKGIASLFNPGGK